MTELSRLLADCDDAGIRLTPSGADELKIDAPRSALTPELVERLRGQKIALLRILNATRYSGPDDWPETIDVREVTPCTKCGSLELWETMAGTWRCLSCEPPDRWRKFARRHGLP